MTASVNTHTGALLPMMADAATKRQLIRQKTIDGLKDIFPIVSRYHTLELSDPHVKEKDYSSNEQKDAIMQGRTLHESIQGTLTLKDQSGKVVDTLKNHTLIQMPYFTERHTFIVGGNEYDLPNQLRLKPGVYTRERGNGEYEASFNLSKGTNFRLAMEPESGKLHMELGASKIALYPLLRALGVPDTDIRKQWGEKLRDMNARLSSEDKEEATLNKVISKIKHSDQVTPATLEGKKDFVHNYLSETAMDPQVNLRTLGLPFDKASPMSMLMASKKLIEVHRGEAKGDDRDSLEFKTIHAADDFFRERLNVDAKRTIARKIAAKLTQTKGEEPLSRIVPSSVFTKSLNGLITSTQLPSIPMQINPIEIIDHAGRVTSLGEGGISSERAIPFESRKVHNTHLGVLDPARTSEGAKAGIDVRATMSAFRDHHGNMYSLMRDARTNKMVHVPVTELAVKTIGFSGQDAKSTHHDAIRGVDVVSVPKGEVDYYVPAPTFMLSPATALVPLSNGIQGNRLIMGSKFQTQAVPLIDREAPLVQVQAARAGQSMEAELARLIVPTARVDGVVHKIDKDYIYIRPDAKTAAVSDTGDLHKIPYDTYFPLASKTYLHNDVNVKVGDKVKQDQPLAESNFTKNGKLALGKNLSVAYMAYYGKNSNDAVVISQGAADKLTSEHMYKEVLQKSPEIITGKNKYVAYYGTEFTAEQLGKLDSNGVAIPGKVFHYGDPLILGLRKSAPTPEAMLLGNLHKSLVKPYRNAAVLWDHAVDGTVQEAVESARQIMVTVRTLEPMKVGDKLANRFGGKGVVSEIIPNERMIKAENGDPVDVLFTSAGVVSRVNPAQIVESALGKVAHKTGKPYVLPLFMDKDHVQFAKDELAKHGVKDKETVYDPVSGKHIPNIFVGRSTILKLFKNTETNYAARGVDAYDINMQPTRGGDEGAKGLGKMEINALLAHNARNVLKEGLTVKSEKSDDFWRAYEFGLPPVPPKTPFVAEKFVAMLKGAGINVDKTNTQAVLGPLTDKDVLKMSSGALATPSLEKSKSFMVSAKNMTPEKGGLFDPVLTGGLGGTRWSHMTLSEPVLNPVFEEPARRLLGMTGKELTDAIGEHGGPGIRKLLNKIDLDAKEKELRNRVKTARGADLDDCIKQLKYVQALKEGGHTKAGDAYILSHIPVTPPVMRPILPSNRGNELQIADINYFYRDVGLGSEALKNVAETGMPTAIADARKKLYDATGALFGLQEPVSPQLRGRDAKGYIQQIAGAGTPKSGFFHKKILKRQQDLSGRATATPDNTLTIDQIGVPEDMLWTTYGKFVMRGLIGQGHKPTNAAQMLEERHPLARAVFNAELQKRPVFVNRAPTLHKHNFVAAYPVPVDGKSLRIQPFLERGMNLDYDGDTMQLHVPISDKAVAEAQQLTMSKLLFSDKNRDDLMVFPQHEAIMGVWKMSQEKANGAPVKFKTHADAMEAYNAGEITTATPVEFEAP